MPGSLSKFWSGKLKYNVFYVYSAENICICEMQITICKVMQSHIFDSKENLEMQLTSYWWNSEVC